MECKREPTTFQNPEGVKCYWMVTLKDDHSPIRYTSDNKGNLHLDFIVSPNKNYVAKEGEIYMCVDCYYKIYIEEKDNE